MASPNKTNLRLTSVSVMLVANAFIWYLLAFDTIKNLLPQGNSNLALQIIGVNTGAIVISALIGSLLFDKVKKRGPFLFYWLTIGIFVSLLPLILNVTNTSDLLIVSAIFGLYFGLGMPVTMGFHSAITSPEERGKVSGIAFLIIGIVFAVLGLVAFHSLIVSCLILASIRLLGLLFVHFVGIGEEPTKQKNKVKYQQIIFNRSFILYFIPWVMFALINFMTMPIQDNIFNTASDQGIISYSLLAALENVTTAIVAVISGFIVDKYGRKRLSIFGFVMLGIGYAVIGILSTNPTLLATNLLVGSLIYFIADGIAWGIFFVLFIFTIWGDLAHTANAEKYYFIGALPYVTSYFMQLLFTPVLSDIEPQTIFPFASFFLFVAVLPLIYAPETLSEKIIKAKDLESYIATAKKKVAKDTQKTAEKQKSTPEKTEPEPSENDPVYEEAKKLAEKYY